MHKVHYVQRVPGGLRPRIGRPAVQNTVIQVAPVTRPLCAQVLAGSRTNTGIWRVVRCWYSA